jgi:hypothetical protein
MPRLLPASIWKSHATWRRASAEKGAGRGDRTLASRLLFDETETVVIRNTARPVGRLDKAAAVRRDEDLGNDAGSLAVVVGPTSVGVFNRLLTATLTDPDADH